MGVSSGIDNDHNSGESHDDVTRPMLGASMGDSCVNCGAPLASDQRYCLSCGERRGRNRFSPQSIASPASQAQAPPAPEPHEPPRRRLSSGTTLITGIATLLLAMGVGVEIGRLGKSSNNNPARASAPVQVVTLTGGGAAATTTPTASTSTTSNTKASTSKAKKAKPTVVTKKVAAKATQAASKVLGASAQNLAPPTVQQGQSCTHGAGCQGGHFTGNFFGP